MSSELTDTPSSDPDLSGAYASLSSALSESSISPNNSSPVGDFTSLSLSSELLSLGGVVGTSVGGSTSFYRKRMSDPLLSVDIYKYR